MEAASVSRRVRLEELKRRKDVAATAAARTNGHRRHEEDFAKPFTYDDKDEIVDSPSDEEALRERVRTWSTTKLVRSFRTLDRKQRVDVVKLKDTIEQDIRGMQELVIAEHEQKRTEELDLHNIQPKRPNWDLKRDMQKRMAKLERRDREARLILIRQRIAAAAATSAKADGVDGTERSAEQLAAAAIAAGTTLGDPLDRAGHASDSESSEEEA